MNENAIKIFEHVFYIFNAFIFDHLLFMNFASDKYSLHVLIILNCLDTYIFILDIYQLFYYFTKFKCLLVFTSLFK